MLHPDLIRTYIIELEANVLVELVQRITGTEWSENWRSWPHCNGQAGCWMHATTPPAPWCWCSCRWCRLARLFGRGGDAGRCRYCGDTTALDDDPAPGLCAMCAKAGRT